MPRRRPIASAALGFAALLVGCRDRQALSGGADHVDTPDLCSLTFRGSQPCGGTVTGGGAGPAGAFSASAIEATLGAGGSPYRFTFWITDTDARESILLQAPPLRDGGAEVFLGVHTTSATVYSTRACTTIAATGEIRITGGTDPDTAFAGATGTIAGTFSIAGSGYAITGSFETPYCRFTSPGG